MKGFKLNTDAETIPGLLGLSDERANALDALFTPIAESIFKESLKNKGLNQCEMFKQFTDVVETDQEVHYAIARASAINMQIIDAMNSPLGGLAASLQGL